MYTCASSTIRREISTGSVSRAVRFSIMMRGSNPARSHASRTCLRCSGKSRAVLEIITILRSSMSSPELPVLSALPCQGWRGRKLLHNGNELNTPARTFPAFFSKSRTAHSLSPRCVENATLVVTWHFGISSSHHLRPLLNREMLNVDPATPPVLLNRSQPNLVRI